MKNLKIGLFTALFVLLGANVAPIASAQYYGRTPVLSVSGQNGGNLTFNISNADAYSRVILYARSQGASFWSTSIDNIGQTDQSGYLNTSLNPGISGNAEFKVTVNGVDSNIAQSGSGSCGYQACGGCGFGCVGGITFSNANPNLNSGQSLSITVSSPYIYSGAYYISSNSNSNVVTASMYANTLNLYGNNSGSSTITVCQNNGSSACGSVYVTVNGGTCTYNCGYGLSLSQTSLNLNIGQSMVVSANNTYGSTLYVASNSNSNVASYTLNGNQITVYGNQTGSSTINVCAAGSGAACANLYVTVGNSGCYGAYSYNCTSITFSQNNVSMYVGQTSTVSVYNSNGLSLYISSNSNSSVASASISGSQINLYALANGSTNILVCAGSSGQCGTLSVTVGGSSGSGNITFSQSNVSLSTGQSSSINIYSTYSGNNFYVQGNSNQGAVTASVSGNVLYLTANSTGNANITICQNSNPTCGTVYVSVNGTGGGSGIWFSQNNVTLSGGQTQSITINSYNYGSGYYISSNSNSSVVSANVVGNSLNLNGLQNGSSTITVCQQTGGGCGSLYISVTGSGYGGSISFSQSNLSISAGQSTAITVYGNQPFYISSNSNSNAASAIISGSTLTIYGNNSGNSTVMVCQNNGISCGSVYITVNGYNNGGNGNLYFTSTTLPTMTLGQYYNYQLPVSGGNAPYTFSITSGSLPAGLALSASGQIFGTVQSTAYSTFSIRVNDTYNRTASASFTINGTGGGVLGSSTYPNGQLINEGGTVYIVYRGQKSAFASASVFTAFGFKFSNVLNVGYSNLANTGYIINNSYTSHPWGAWVQSGSTIYFVHQDGLIPVPSWDVFVNNRGASSLVVPANMYDFQKPILSVMSANDSRLY